MQAVLCFGNEWHGDDGFGLAVYNALLQSPASASLFSPVSNRQNCQIYFCANNAHFAPTEIFQADRIIIVDALQSAELVPGELHWASASDFIAQRARNLHDGGVEEFIRHLPILVQPRPMPEVDVLYITVAPVAGFNEGLSPVVSAGVEKAGIMICEALMTQKVTCRRSLNAGV